MKWNCPHCSTALAIADEKLTQQWSFSRCYQCGGFAMVRRSDSGTESNVLLPEANEIPLLSKQATERLQQIQNKNSNTNAAVVPPAPPAFPTTTITAPPATPVTAMTTVSANARTTVATVPVPEVNKKTESIINEFDFSSDFLSDQEELPSRSQSRSKAIPIAMGLAGVLAVVSGTYLYRQGQHLFTQARMTARQESRTLTARAAAVSARTVEDSVPVTAPVTAPVQEQAALVAQNPSTLTTPSASLSVSMSAPVRPSRDISGVNRSPAVEAPAVGVTQATDQGGLLVVSPKVNRASLRGGPGVKFPVLGLADATARLLVKEWRNDWFKVEVSPTVSSTGEAWIRNDLVTVSKTAKNE